MTFPYHVVHDFIPEQMLQENINWNLFRHFDAIYIILEELVPVMVRIIIFR